MLRKSLETQLNQYIRSGNTLFLKSLEETMLAADKADLFTKNDLDYFLFLPFKLNFNKLLAEHIVITLLTIAKKFSQQTLNKIFASTNKGFINPIAQHIQSAKVLDLYLEILIYHTTSLQGFLNRTFTDNLFFKTIATFVPAEKQKNMVDVFFQHLVENVKHEPSSISIFLKAINEALTAKFISLDEAQRLLKEGLGTFSSKEELVSIVEKQKQSGLKAIRQYGKNIKQFTDAIDKNVASISANLFVPEEKETAAVKTTTLDLTSHAAIQSLTGVRTTTLVLEDKKRDTKTEPTEIAAAASSATKPLEFNPSQYQQFGLLRKLNTEAVMNYLVRGQDERRVIDPPQLQRSQSFTYGSRD